MRCCVVRGGAGCKGSCTKQQQHTVLAVVVVELAAAVAWLWPPISALCTLLYQKAPLLYLVPVRRQQCCQAVVLSTASVLQTSGRPSLLLCGLRVHCTHASTRSHTAACIVHLRTPIQCPAAHCNCVLNCATHCALKKRRAWPLSCCMLWLAYGTAVYE